MLFEQLLSGCVSSASALASARDPVCGPVSCDGTCCCNYPMLTLSSFWYEEYQVDVLGAMPGAQRANAGRYRQCTGGCRQPAAVAAHARHVLRRW